MDHMQAHELAKTCSSAGWKVFTAYLDGEIQTVEQDIVTQCPPEELAVLRRERITLLRVRHWAGLVLKAAREQAQ